MLKWPILSWSGGNARRRLNRILLSDGNTVANYRAGIGQTDAGSGKCSAWANQIGAGTALLQSNGSLQPTIQADGSIVTDGSGKYLQTAAFTLAQPLTIYYVGIQNTWVSGKTFFDGLTNLSALLRQTTATPEVDLYSGTSIVASNTAFTVGAKHVAVCVYNGASSTLSVDGGTATTGNPGATAMGGFTLGSTGTAGFYANVTTYEVILRSVADSSPTQAQIQAYLKSIYGTP